MGKSSFQKQLERDLEKVFHNTAEFAQLSTFVYDGKKYNAPIILDTDINAKRSSIYANSGGTNKRDRAQGIFQCDAVLYINQRNVDFIPRHGATVSFIPESVGESRTYTIENVEFECGEIIVELVRLDE